MYETDELGEAVREFAKRIEFVCAAEMVITGKSIREN